MIYAKADSTAPKTEDELILKLFGEKRDGYFVDIGAHDGRSYSNSRPLWERGWSGILVEPDPDTFKILCANYPNQDRLTLINAAICAVDGNAQFAKHRDPQRTGWHSMCKEWIATWGDGAARVISVKAMRFESLPLPPAIDFLSVDTEGYDYEIIRLIPESIRPRLIICEVDKHLVREHVESEMARRGYEFVWGTYLNSAYVDASF